MTGATTLRGRIVDYVRQHPGCRVSDVAGAVGRPRAQVSTELLYLCRTGHVRREGAPGVRGREGYRHYVTDDPGHAHRPAQAGEGLVVQQHRQWREVEELAADIAEDLQLMHTHPLAVLTTLHDRVRGRAA